MTTPVTPDEGSITDADGTWTIVKQQPKDKFGVVHLNGAAKQNLICDIGLLSDGRVLFRTIDNGTWHYWNKFAQGWFATKDPV